MVIAETLKEGDKAPEFELKDQNGVTVAPNQFRGKRVILYFYPKDDTPGCTKEACSFRDGLETLLKRNTVVLGVSNDDTDSHRRFASKYGLNFKILSDVDKSVSTIYGVYKKKKMYGKEFWGIERSTFIIDERGVITKIFRRVNVDGHFEEIAKYIQESEKAMPTRRKP
jgi:peroxiredoxin Q/BCP